MAVTLADLRTRARVRVDQEKDTGSDAFVSDANLNEMINQSAAELYDLLVNRYEQYFQKKATFSTVADQDEYTFASIGLTDFYKLTGVDIKYSDTGGDFARLRSFMWAERERFMRSSAAWSYTPTTHRPRYALRGNSIFLAPVPDTINEMRVWYIPRMAKLAMDTDELFDTPNHYDEYVVVDVARKLAIKEDRNVSRDLAGEKAALIKRIEDSAPNRDAEEPQRMREQRGSYDDWFGWYDSLGDWW